MINYNVVRDAPITPIHTRAINANGSPLDVIGETVADIILGDLTVNQKFVVIRNLTVECLLGADFCRHTVQCVAITHCQLELVLGLQFQSCSVSDLHRLSHLML